MKKVALYCRVSSDDQKERDTISNQIEILRTYIEMKEELELVDEFLDDGVSGTIPFEERPGGKNLIEKAKVNSFDSILVYKIDRFGRDTLSGLSAVELLSKYDVEIISLTEPFDLSTPTGRFQFINYLNMAELDRNNILDRMFLGASRAAKQGKWLGGIVPYGYFKNKEGYLEVNDTEAIVVRKIFDMYVTDNMTGLDIAIYLNNTGIDCNYAARGTGKKNKTDKKSLWAPSTIQRILSNTTYMGIHEYGKRSTKRKEPIVRSVPSIIPTEVFDKAKKLRTHNTKIAKRNSPNRDFLLRTLIKCNECGRTYYGVFYRKSPSVYSCSGKKKINKDLYGTKCSNVNLVADDIEEYVWNMCKELILNIDDYVIETDNSIEKDELITVLSNLNNKIVDLDKEKNNILKLYRKNLIDDTDLEEQLKDIKNELNNHNKLIDTVNEKLKILDNKDLVVSDFKQHIEEYRNNLDNISNTDKMDIIRLLLKEIIVSSRVEDGEKIAEYKLNWILSDLVFEPSRLQMLSQKVIEKKASYYILDNTEISKGVLLTNLRVRNNVTLKQLSADLNLSVNTLKSIECGDCRSPYYYYSIYCRHFNETPYTYLNYKSLPLDTFKDRVEALKAILGMKSNKDLDNSLGLYKGAISDAYNRKRNFSSIDMIIKENLNRYTKEK